MIANAGANLPRRDEVDERILNEAAGKLAVQDRGAIKWNKTEPASPEVKFMGIINSQDELKPDGADDNWTAWPDLSMKPGETVALDSDGDGIPDAWEEANGLDKTDANDGALIASNGYSNLENYLNNIGNGDGTGIVDSVDVDSEIVKFYSISNSVGQLVFSSAVDSVKADIQLPSVLQEGIYILTYYSQSGHKWSEKKIF